MVSRAEPTTIIGSTCVFIRSTLTYNKSQNTDWRQPMLSSQVPTSDRRHGSDITPVATRPPIHEKTLGGVDINVSTPFLGELDPDKTHNCA
jgi:hypothetical protein